MDLMGKKINTKLFRKLTSDWLLSTILYTAIGKYFFVDGIYQLIYQRNTFIYFYF